MKTRNDDADRNCSFDLAVVISFLSVLVVTRKNPVHSVMWMLLLFFHIAGLYLFLNAEFIAAIQVIVYAGAILVLFLFVVLLLNLKEEQWRGGMSGPWPLRLMAAVGLFLVIIVSLKSFVAGPKGSFTNEAIKAATNTKVLGKLLYTEYPVPL